MRLFAIDADNTITAFPAAEQIPEGQEHFANEKELAKVATNWPADRLVHIWNSFAGVAGFGGDLKPVKKFTNRKAAVARIWKAIQKLDSPAESEAAETAPQATTRAPGVAKGARKAAKPAKAATTTDGTPTAREGSKKATVLELLRRRDGATLAEIAKATEWQNHSIRGLISGTITKKMGLTIESARNDAGERRYRIVG
jgi:hypothetical protein